MGENLHGIDKLFRSSIDEHEEAPSQNVWNGIRNELDENPAVFHKRKNKAWRYLVFLLMFLLGAISYKTYTAVKYKNELAKEKGAGKINNRQPISSQSSVSDKAALPVTELKTDKNASVSVIVRNINSVKTASPQTRQVLKEIGETKKVAAGKMKLLKKGKPTIQIAANEMNALQDEEFTNDMKTPVTQAHLYPSAGKSERRIIPGRMNVDIVPVYFTEAPAPVMKINRQLLTPDVATSLKKSKPATTSNPFHFILMPFYSQQFTFNRLENDRHGGRPDHDDDRDKIKAGEQHQTSSSVGILFELPVGKKWSIQSGVSYSSVGIDIRPKKVFAEIDDNGMVKYRFDCSAGYSYLISKNGTAPVIGDSAEVTSSFNTLKYITVPVSVNYKLSAGKFNIIPTVGVAINSIVKQKIETTLISGSVKDQQTVNEIKGLRSNYFTAFTGIALEYSLNKHIAVNLLPAVNLALSSVNKDVQVKSYYNSMSLSTGVKIKF